MPTRPPPPPSAAPGAPVPEAPAGTACPNCGSAGVRRYCPECGQELPGPGDYSLRAHLAELTDDLTSGHGRVARTFGVLVARPGALTVDHLAGRRGRYLRPVRLFLLVNVLLFLASPQVPFFSYSLDRYLRYAPPSPALVSSMVRRAAEVERTPGATGQAAFEAYRKDFDNRVETQRKSFVILFAPALALVLRALLAFRRAPPGVPRVYGEHLVFALHGLTFLWLVLAAVGVTGRVAGMVLRTAPQVAVVPILGLLLAIPVHVYLALRRAYALSRIRALAVTLVLAVSFALCLVAYRGLLFFTTYYLR